MTDHCCFLLLLLTLKQASSSSSPSLLLLLLSPSNKLHRVTVGTTYVLFVYSEVLPIVDCIDGRYKDSQSVRSRREDCYLEWRIFSLRCVELTRWNNRQKANASSADWICVALRSEHGQMIEINYLLESNDTQAEIKLDRVRISSRAFLFFFFFGHNQYII